MIDTPEKRRSAAGVPFLPLGPGVTPNASKDGEWRQQSAWSYSGINVGEPEVGENQKWRFIGGYAGRMGI